MSAFEDFVTLELPRRSAHLTKDITSYDGDPNDGGAPAIIQSAPLGSWFREETAGKWWRKTETNWVDAGSGGTGWVKIVDLATQYVEGVVDLKVWQDSPNNTILQSCRTSDEDVVMSVQASFPIVEINSIQYTLDPATDGGHYEGDISLTISEGETDVVVRTPNDELGALDTIDIDIETPPVIISANFTGGYPGSQTELKAGDTFQLTGLTNKNADAIQILDFGACIESLEVITLGTSFTVTGTIADRGTTTQSLGARLRARAPSGALSVAIFNTAFGGSVDGFHVVKLNNTYPTVDFPGPISYPGSQQALKNSENATVPVTLADLDTVAFNSPNGDLSITNPTTIEATKTVARIAGTYNVSTNNLRCTANRAANDATTVDQTVVQIAHVAAAVAVREATARVRSGPSPGANTTISIVSDQELLSAPSVDPAASRGTFIGSWAGGPSTWTRSLQVPDSQNPADGSLNSWSNLSATNLAGLVTTTIDTGGGDDATYVIGGFTSRTVNYPPFTANCTETFPLTDESKLTAGSFSNGNPSVVQPFGTSDTTDAGKEGWCAPTAASGTAVKMRMLHSPTVAANAAGITLASVEETP
jgi:hypothetical protein